MDSLRKALYAEAAVWAVFGMVLVVAPGFLPHTLFREPAGLEREQAWVRLLGVQSLGLGMLMTMVGHRVEELWWWSWAFALVTVLSAAVVVLNAAFGLDPGQSRAFWWTFACATVVLAAGLLYGLFVSSREQPVP